MPDRIPAAAREAARQAVRAKLAGPMPGYLLDEIADAALDAAWPAISEYFAKLLLDQNPDRGADFSAGVDWAADTIRNAT